MYILGLNAYHGDAAACLVKDGQVIAAIEEERLTRIKHHAGFPKSAVQACLGLANIRLEDVHHVAINRDPKASFGRKVLYTLTHLPSAELIVSRVRNALSWIRVGRNLYRNFPEGGMRAQFHHVEHHMAHLASAFYPSPFKRAIVLSVDGFGDFASAAWGIGDQQGIELAGKVHFPHSLGIFYQAMTQYLGFPNYGDEYKLMGLAAYGKPDAKDDVCRLVRFLDDGSFELNLDFFRHHRENVPYTWNDGAPMVGKLYDKKLLQLLGPARLETDMLTQRHKDLAASTQLIYEQALFNLINKLCSRTGICEIALAGGCAQNSSANGLITAKTPIKRLYIPSAAHDAGGAIGAALHVWSTVSSQRSKSLDHAYLGPSLLPRDIDKALKNRAADLLHHRIEVIPSENGQVQISATVDLLVKGKVVGWCQGRMEWGPRALGSRSILADPRCGDMRSLLNEKIKLRESYRPFAPSVLSEHIPEWFDLPRKEDADSPFMAKVFSIKAEKRRLIPAVTHVDGTGRLQSVEQNQHPEYRALIEGFYDKTGVPMVLNTSFNENEPIVTTAAEALDCFLRTRMDALCIGTYLIIRTVSN